MSIFKKRINERNTREQERIERTERFKKRINAYAIRKQEIAERREDEEYINDCLPNHHKNAYYMMCGNCDVIVRNPQKYDEVRRDTYYIEIDNIPTYTITFSTLEKARKFMENNFFMGAEHQKNVKIEIVEGPFSGATIVMQPTRIDYEIHIEVDSDEVGKKLVKMFRRQYIHNKDYKVDEKQEFVSQVAESEIEKLGIKF